MDRPGSRVRFADFEADTATGDLYRDGQVVRLQEQPRQVLAALLQRPGEVITREELRDRLWKTDTFVDFEHGLNTAIKKVRQALGDSADQPRFIETLAKRGYRFIAPVTSGATDVVPASPRSPDRQVRWAVLAAFLLSGIGVAIWVARLPPRQPQAVRAPAQLAVLPLRLLEGQNAPESAYLGVGIADAITTRLANVRKIALRPTTAVLPYQGSALEPSQVASALGVEHLLVGTIQRAEDSYRVAVQLVRRDGVAEWGRTYDLPRANLLRLQDEVADNVASALQVELSAPERERLNVRYTANPAAFDSYLRGRTMLLNYTDTNMREAIERFEQALTLDPSYALARAALATACAWFSVRYAYESEANVWGQRAEAEARRALAQDSGLADAHLAIASAAGTLYRGFDWKTVMAETGTALALDSSLELAHVARTRAFYHVGAFDEARQEAQRARALNPAPNVELERLEIATELFSGNFRTAADRAAALVRRTDAPAVRHYLGLARFYLGDLAGAREMLASAKRGDQLDTRSQASLASIEAAAGLGRQARNRARAIERGPYMDHHVAYSLGATWAQLGDAAASIRWLQQAADTGFPCESWFERDTLLDPIRGGSAFRDLMSRINARRRGALSS